jgi:hypothetical protein
MITARANLAGAGTQNAGLAFGGQNPSAVACTEAYNGTSWTAGGALITARTCLAGAGTQNEALAFGGYVAPARVACTEEYNGTSWTAGGALITLRRNLAGAGIQNAALAFGGTTPPTNTCTETYNGTSWSAGGALNNARYQLGGAGTQNAALAFGGYSSFTFRACTEAYNGISWSNGGAMINARCIGGGAGTQNAALTFGGLFFPFFNGTTCTEAYNGTSWSAGGALITGRYSLAGAGTQNEALAFGGSTGTNVACTEEFAPSLIPGILRTFDYSSTTGNIAATGSLFGTASIALNATTASFVQNAVSASFATTASVALSVTGGFSKSFSIINNSNIAATDVGNFPVWRCQVPCTASMVLGYTDSGSAVLVNATKNGSTLLSSDLSISTDTWVSSSTLQNENFSIGDILAFRLVSFSSTPKEITIQTNFIY